jgi:hypothetical protein
MIKNNFFCPENSIYLNGASLLIFSDSAPEQMGFVNRADQLAKKGFEVFVKRAAAHKGKKRRRIWQIIWTDRRIKNRPKRVTRPKN